MPDCQPSITSSTFFARRLPRTVFSKRKTTFADENNNNNNTKRKETKQQKTGCAVQLYDFEQEGRHGCGNPAVFAYSFHPASLFSWVSPPVTTAPHWDSFPSSAAALLLSFTESRVSSSRCLKVPPGHGGAGYVLWVIPHQPHQGRGAFPEPALCLLLMMGQVPQPPLALPNTRVCTHNHESGERGIIGKPSPTTQPGLVAKILMAAECAS